MIVTEPGLRWRLAVRRNDPVYGGAASEYRCVEYPRLTRLVQRQSRDAEVVETYHVDGIEAQHYLTPTEALEAMESNP